LLHACADSALALRREYGLKPEDVVEARALLHQDAFGIVCEPVAMRRKPPSQNVAQFSAQFVIAACLVRGRLGFAELNADALGDPQILELAQRVTHDVYPGSLYPKYLSGGVIIKTRDGRTLRHLEAINRGNGARALSRGDIVAKFMENAEMALPRTRADRILDAVLKFDRLTARTLGQTLSL
jgi:2-methylcitrate dehydratase PrpD